MFRSQIRSTGSEYKAPGTIASLSSSGCQDTAEHTSEIARLPRRPATAEEAEGQRLACDVEVCDNGMLSAPVARVIVSSASEVERMENRLSLKEKTPSEKPGGPMSAELNWPSQQENTSSSSPDCREVTPSGQPDSGRL
ncbi:hypothetical protein NQZ68_032988 [Dissostichus eleginoides]|nr:hypothetical protein NQZ68_032988 [Dissostichus eleginoides]